MAAEVGIRDQLSRHRLGPGGRPAAVISYFDTSAIVPRVWHPAAVTEVRAALAQARRMARLDASELRSAAVDIEAHFFPLDLVEVDEALALHAG